jgi:hypothetical protein
MIALLGVRCSEDVLPFEVRWNRQRRNLSYKPIWLGIEKITRCRCARRSDKVLGKMNRHLSLTMMVVWILAIEI